VKPLLDDFWGFFQQVLSSAGITPSGNPDEVGASDIFDGMRRTSGHPGMITPIVLNDAPAIYGIRMLLLDGSGILRANYSDLDDAVYVGDSDNGTAGAFYHANDAGGTIRATGGPYLILPDGRGRFPRGLDSSGTIDPDGASRFLGDDQLDATERHNHLIRAVGTSKYAFNPARGAATGSNEMIELSSTTADIDIIADSVNIGEDITGFSQVTGVGKVDSETRARNFAVNWAIWY
jgi:hypothetical protein